jgi:hypothetical protein
MSGNQHHIHGRHRRRGAGDAIGAAANPEPVARLDLAFLAG